jgi:uncharacterized protein
MMHTFLWKAVEFLREFVEVAALGFLLAGVINAVVNKEIVARTLRRSVFGANALAAVWGFLTPLCCCSGIPTALTLYRAGSRRGPASAFLISVPWFNWYGLTALIVFLGWWAGLIVALSAVVVGFLAGVLVDALGEHSTVPGQEQPPRGRTHGECAGPGCCDTRALTQSTQLLDLSDPARKARLAVRFAVDLLRELGPWMLGGVLLGAAVEAIVPKDFVTNYLGRASIVSLLVALAIAAAFYTDSLASLPWVGTLLQKGLGVGSGMVLLVAGGGTNLSTLGPVARVMGPRTAIVYASSVVGLTGLIGYVLNRVF